MQWSIPHRGKCGSEWRACLGLLARSTYFVIGSKLGLVAAGQRCGGALRCAPCEHRMPARWWAWRVPGRNECAIVAVSSEQCRSLPTKSINRFLDDAHKIRRQVARQQKPGRFVNMPAIFMSGYYQIGKVTAFLRVFTSRLWFCSSLSLTFDFVSDSGARTLLQLGSCFKCATELSRLSLLKAGEANKQTKTKREVAGNPTLNTGRLTVLSWTSGVLATCD
jgi:hypothetical protein